MVINKYNNTTKIVTIKDLLKKIINKIKNKYNLPNTTLTWIDEHTIKITNSMTINNFNKTINTTLPQHKPHTLTKLTFDALNHQPQPKNTINIKNVRIKIKKINNLRITKLHIALQTPTV